MRDDPQWQLKQLGIIRDALLYHEGVKLDELTRQFYEEGELRGADAQDLEDLCRGYL